MNAAFREPKNTIVALRKHIFSQRLLFPWPQWYDVRREEYILDENMSTKHLIDAFREFKVPNFRVIRGEDQSNALRSHPLCESISSSVLPTVPSTEVETTFPKSVSEEERTYLKRFKRIVSLDVSANVRASGLFLYGQMKKKTSQGNIFLAFYLLPSPYQPDVFLTPLYILKLNVVRSDILWWMKGDPSSIELVKGLKGHYVSVSANYMDAYCMINFSTRLAETRRWIHVPFCAGVGLCTLKAPSSPSLPTLPFTEWINEEKKHKVSQAIYMEYLPQSVFEILKDNHRGRLWMSMLFQIFATSFFLRKRFGFYHNDLHSENIRIRRCPKSSRFYYYWKDEDLLFDVPVFGYICVFIDFGRSLLSFEGDEPFIMDCVPRNCGIEKKGFVSSEFRKRGKCAEFVPDNPCFDIYRFVCTVDDVLPSVEEPYRKTIEELVRTTTTIEGGRNLLQDLNALSEKDMSSILYLIETYPRKKCAVLPEQFLRTTFRKEFEVADPNEKRRILSGEGDRLFFL